MQTGAGTSRSMTTVAAAVEMRIIKLHIRTHEASESDDFGPHKQENFVSIFVWLRFASSALMYKRGSL